MSSWTKQTKVVGVYLRKGKYGMRNAPRIDCTELVGKRMKGRNRWRGALLLLSLVRQRVDEPCNQIWGEQAPLPNGSSEILLGVS
jgi:hypothetical protein